MTPKLAKLTKRSPMQSPTKSLSWSRDSKPSLPMMNYSLAAVFSSPAVFSSFNSSAVSMLLFIIRDTLSPTPSDSRQRKHHSGVVASSHASLVRYFFVYIPQQYRLDLTLSPMCPPAVVSFVPWVLIDSLGRKPLLIGSVTFMTIIFACMTGATHQIETGAANADVMGRFAVALAFLYLSSFTIGFQVRFIGSHDGRNSRDQSAVRSLLLLSSGDGLGLSSRDPSSSHSCPRHCFGNVLQLDHQFHRGGDLPHRYRQHWLVSPVAALMNVGSD